MGGERRKKAVYISQESKKYICERAIEKCIILAFNEDKTRTKDLPISPTPIKTV